MNYFVAVEVENGYENVYECNTKIEKGVFVVVANYEDLPVTAKVVKLLSRRQVLTSKTTPMEIISVIDMKSWNAKIERELERAVLFDKMENKIKEISMIEKLEKFAGKNPDMMSLYQEFMGQTSMNESEVGE